MKTFFEISNLTKGFGNLVAVNNVSISLKKGELAALIGPNGAGKTTLLNLISGKLEPDSGEISLKGKSVTGLPPYSIVEKGIVRTFQITNIFPNLTILENMMIPLLSSQKKTFDFYNSLDELDGLIEEAKSVLQIFGIDNSEKTIRSLTQGEKRLIELAVVIPLAPEILLLDEPTAGVGASEINRITKAIEKIHKEANTTIIFIEHDLELAFGISSRVLVMHQGKIIADDEPTKIQNNEKVKNIYGF